MRHLLVALVLTLGACLPLPDDAPGSPDASDLDDAADTPDADGAGGGCASAITCLVIPDRLLQGFAARGTHLGVIDGRLRIFEGGELVGESVELVHTAVGVPSGWLVASGTRPVIFSTLELRGATTRTQAFDMHTSPEMAHGPGDRVLLAWLEYGAPDPRRVWVALATPDGTITVPAAAAFEAPWTQVSVATDGTSFFAAADRTVARITPEGAVTVHADFPLAVPGGFPLWARITSDGPGGWYVAAGDAVAPTYVAQRFDATGAPVGEPLRPDLANVVGVIADGDDLLFLTFEPVNDGAVSLVLLHRLSPDGALSPPHLIGRGNVNFAIARHGPNVVIGWVALTSSGHASYVATITP